jgi:transcriptional regulator with XRE-family HTH domain
VRESQAAVMLRRELGRQLAGRRKAAGYLQRELGTVAGYSRTAIANAETGSARAGRLFWIRMDQVLGTGELFARGYDRIQARVAAESQIAAGQHSPAQERQVPGRAAVTAAGARQACLDRGWPVEEGAGGRLWLRTGTVIDGLEVPRPAGLLAMGWWLYTRGVADEIRGLPALPDPATALAVIVTEPACYFLARSGDCPWTRRDADAAAGAGGRAVLRWHAEGGRVPAPPSPVPGGRARWAHLPPDGGQLASPLALLHVLAYAVAATSHGAGVLLPGGVRAVPALPATTPP